MSDRFKGVIAFKVDLADGRALIVDPADVTIVTVNHDGPAPATPDGHVPLGFHLTVVAERDAAEARIAAALKLVNGRDDVWRWDQVRRALSVEASGTEGGGGHE
jgi:hypothetical protein